MLLRVFTGILNAIRTLIHGPMTRAEVDRVLAERGRIIAVANLVDVRPMELTAQGAAMCDWEDGRYVFVLRDVFRVATPIIRGHLSLWWVADDFVTQRSAPELGLAGQEGR